MLQPPSTQSSNTDYSSVYAVPAVSSKTISDPTTQDSTTDEPDLWGTLTGDYQLHGRLAGTGWQGAINDSFAEKPNRCPTEYDCTDTCNSTSAATRNNCARDMNWVTWCEWKPPK